MLRLDVVSISNSFVEHRLLNISFLFQISDPLFFAKLEGAALFKSELVKALIEKAKEMDGTTFLAMYKGDKGE